MLQGWIGNHISRDGLSRSIYRALDHLGDKYRSNLGDASNVLIGSTSPVLHNQLRTKK